MKYARNIVEKVWQAASAAGYGSYFPAKDGGGVTDDHLPVNEKAGIPCIDIINHYPDCEQSNFGPTWHTINDDMQHIDKTAGRRTDVDTITVQLMCGAVAPVA